MISVEEHFMNLLKKRVLLGLFLIATVVVLTSATTSPLFTKSVVITKIYPHQLGYRVIYMANDLEHKEVYLPVELFKIDKGSKIFYGHDKAFPYMQIFWNNGEFSHVKLYVKPDFRDISWGTLYDPDAYDGFFGDQDITFEF